MKKLTLTSNDEEIEISKESYELCSWCGEDANIFKKEVDETIYAGHGVDFSGYDYISVGINPQLVTPLFDRQYYKCREEKWIRARKDNAEFKRFAVDAPDLTICEDCVTQLYNLIEKKDNGTKTTKAKSKSKRR